VIGDIAIAATLAATTRGGSSGGGPTNGTNGARKDNSITTTGNANTVSDAGKNKSA
jgi:hypothetical protein